MKFCSNCGHPVTRIVPAGDNRHRFVCERCDQVFYENPKLVVGCVPQWQDHVLLCRRAIEPRRGAWTLPAGFMELGESTREGAQRETLEEANARVEVGELYTMVNLPHIDQVHLFFLADLQDLDFSPGVESLETALFTEAEVPWDELAFRSIRYTLEWFFADRRTGRFITRTEDLGPGTPMPQPRG